jgi:ABC-type antimicrobial peptide transport system permease subunit
MFRNYYKIALRNLLRNKVYSFINISGLAIGMSVALLIGLWIWDEVSWDHTFSRHDRLARVMNNRSENGKVHTGSGSDVPLEEQLRTKYGSDFKHIAMGADMEAHLLTVAEKKIQRVGFWCQADLPVMLTLKMIKGSIDALKDPSSVLVNASLAKALFGSDDPINRTIQLDDKFQVKVAGVYEDLPSNAFLHDVDYLLPWEKYLDTHVWVKNTQTEWGYNFIMTFVELADHADIDKVNARIRHIPSEHMNGSKEELFLHPMDKWHLYNEFKEGRASTGRIQFVWLFGTIAIFVLLLACINFMNLSTARSERRAREVGIRKTMGSLRWQLIGQFLGESLNTACLSLVLAIVLTQLLMPLFNNMSGKQLSIPWGQPAFWLAIIVFTVFTGIVSGSYPALYLSRFEPVKVLKGTFRTGHLAALPRKVLVVVQFTVSVVLVIGTLIVYRQIQFARSRPINYERDHLITADLLNIPAIKPHFNAICNDLVGTGAVEAAAGSSATATDSWGTMTGYTWPGIDPNFKPAFSHSAITHDYGRTLQWQVVEGRDFNKALHTDSSAILLNQAAVKLAGFKNAVGQVISWEGHPHPVIGVIKDMVTDSPYDPPIPTVYFIDPTWINFITIRLKKNVTLAQGQAIVQKVFKQYDPQGLIGYWYAKDSYELKFAGEQRIGKIASFFTVLAVLISCLGLFGLASFVAEQRTREIGVRKVLGATVFNLWGTLSRDFITLVIIACAIAIPLGTFMLDHWLARYSYRTTIPWGLCALAVLGAMLLTLLTVSYQTLRAAVANPVKSLRTE